jgi:hypothetical protein
MDNDRYFTNDKNVNYDYFYGLNTELPIFEEPISNNSYLQSCSFLIMYCIGYINLMIQ